MSTITPSVWIGRPSWSRTIVSRSHTHLTEPSAAIMRYSRSYSISCWKVRISSISTSSRSAGCRRSAHSSGSATQRSAGKPSSCSIWGETYENGDPGSHRATYDTAGTCSTRLR